MTRTISGNTIRIGIEGESSAAQGWIGLGVQTVWNAQVMSNADLAITFVNESGSPAVYDYIGPNGYDGAPTKDNQQDITLVKASSVNGLFSAEVAIYFSLQKLKFQNEI